MEQTKGVVSGGPALPQVVDPLRRSFAASLRRWFEGFIQQGLFRTLEGLLENLSMIPVEAIGSQDNPSPDRPVQRAAKKWLGMLTRFLLAIVPSRFQWTVEYFLVGPVDPNLISEEIGKMPISPPHPGGQKKRDDLAKEENPCWVKAIQAALPDEDDPADSSYEPIKSETESDEYKSQNDTETDLEIEGKDGLMMLKEQQTQQDELGGIAETSEPEGREVESRSSGDGSEHPDLMIAPSSGQGETLDSPAAEMATQIQEVMGSPPASEGPDTSLGNDSQDQWVELSG